MSKRPAEAMTDFRKEYLGDSVYVTFDGHGLTLTTENGAGPSNTIYLESEVYEALVEYVAMLKRRKTAAEPKP